MRKVVERPCGKRVVHVSLFVSSNGQRRWERPQAGSRGSGHPPQLLHSSRRVQCRLAAFLLMTR